MNGSDGVFLTGIDHVGRPKVLRKGQFFVVQIHGNDGICPSHPRANHRRQTHTANTEDGHALIGLHIGCVNDRTGASHDGAANDGGDVGFNIGIYFHDILLISNGVVGPSENILRRGDTV